MSANRGASSAAVASIVAALVWLGPLAVGAAAQIRNVIAEVTPVLGSDAAPQGAGVRAALQVVLPEGLHVNSNRPRESFLIPIRLTVSPPPGVTVEEVVYPAPTDLVQEGASLPLSVFEREFAIGVALEVAADAPVGDLVVPGELYYQACDEKMCYTPRRAQTSWTLRVRPAGAAAKPLNAPVIDTVAWGTGEKPSATAPIDRPAILPPAAGTSDADALALLDSFTEAGTAGGYLGTEEFLRFIDNAEQGVRERGMFEGRGPLTILAIVLLGGLALNLTPCVLPMIPINLAIIGAGAQAGSRFRGFLLGGAYGAAMAIVYGGLGLIVILTAGTFGTINASPWFNLGIAVLFVVLALAMFDVIQIDFSRLSGRFQIAEQSRGSFVLAFTMGTVAALLAGACVAPVVIQVVLLSSNLYATGTTAALALPFFLGLGMALPWPIAGAGIAALPKPGAWMVRIKQVFGVVILGTAIYYGYLAYGLFANRWVEAGAVASSVEEKLKEGWHSSLALGLATAQREQKPVLIDFWATWCKNCLTMDKTTLADPRVTEALDGYVKIKYQAEFLDEPPARDVVERFEGVVGLPAYVILKPKS